MAAAQPSLSTDHYTCPVCLEVLNVPVTIPCGHSYCMECINKHWDRSGLMGTYRCPQCRMEFHPRPKLHKNLTLTNMIGELKEKGVIRAPPQGNAGPASVLCDSCPVRKRRASKTCMTCMASYCESHLQPHLDLAAFKRHKLEEPTRNLEEKLCSKHQKVLEMFCRTDEICICSMCAATEHKSHHTKILVEEITERKENLESILQSIERLKSEVCEAIRGHKRGELSKVGGVIKQLEKEIKEGFHDLQMVTNEIFVFVDLLPSAQVSGSTHFLVFSPHSDARSLTLDLDTAHKRLHLSKEKKKVTCEEKEIQYHGHDDRFEKWQQILCREALWWTRHYWEVEWSGDKADIGVTYRGIGRKEAGNECVLGLNDKSWSLCCSEAGVSAWHNNQKTDIRVPISHKIGVYLDRPGGSLSFYNVSDTMTLLHKFNASFTEPLFAGFRIRPNCSVTIFSSPSHGEGNPNLDCKY
uniref:Uncharacterized protein n=1 Tax=Erpetoichthys calabaricus TaxID=27687 RepID=A0A8C4TK94_ERPCA